jgi:hypothetical protein
MIDGQDLLVKRGQDDGHYLLKCSTENDDEEEENLKSQSQKQRSYSPLGGAAGRSRQERFDHSDGV